MSKWSARDITDSLNERNFARGDEWRVPPDQRVVAFSVRKDARSGRAVIPLFVSAEPGQTWDDLPRPVRAIAWREARRALRLSLERVGGDASKLPRTPW